ncbi:MAG: hypothetical protein JW794_02160 [Candidatus Cloacimonetes bacterium]|nr:hypothetical protein [Candidatus Cloacimonadota bacterium]
MKNKITLGYCLYYLFLTASASWGMKSSSNGTLLRTIKFNRKIVAFSAAVSDVDNDEIPEIICAAHDHNLYVLRPDRTVMDVWPQLAYNGDANYWSTSPILANLIEDDEHVGKVVKWK